MRDTAPYVTDHIHCFICHSLLINIITANYNLLDIHWPWLLQCQCKHSAVQWQSCSCMLDFQSFHAASRWHTFSTLGVTYGDAKSDLTFKFFKHFLSQDQICVKLSSFRRLPIRSYICNCCWVLKMFMFDWKSSASNSLMFIHHRNVQTYLHVVINSQPTVSQ